MTVYLDACFSGGSEAGTLIREASPVYVQAELPDAVKTRLTVLTAASGREVASWDKQAGHGLFTHHLLDALYGRGDRNDDGRVTAAEVMDYLANYMTRAAMGMRGRDQNATLLGTASAVLARAVGGMFPERPLLADGETESLAAKATATTAPDTQTAVQRDLYVLEMRRAHEAQDYDKVLELTARFKENGVELPPLAGYLQGLALVQMRRHAEAQKSLTWYVTTTGTEGEHYKEVLKVLLDLKDVLAAEDGVYERARSRGTAAVLGAYLESYPAGRHVEDARRLQREAVDDEAFRKARTTGTAAAYETYLRTYPNGRHAEEARRLQAKAEVKAKDDQAFARARRTGTAAAYATYLREYPSGRHAGEARRLRAEAEDDQAFSRAQAADTSAAYETYLREYPKGRHAEEARRLRKGALAAERQRPGTVFRDCDRCPELVTVPAGHVFSLEATRTLLIREPFAVGIYEVTFAEWEACVAGGGCGRYRPDDEGWGRGRRPVINVSWNDAQRYVMWLSWETGEEYRLLGENEWEYVARAGTKTAFHTGDTISTDQANYNGNYTYGNGRKGVYRGKTMPAGSFGANGFGLHDVHGNVWEWTENCWNRECWGRTIRGGSWRNNPKLLRSANRDKEPHGARHCTLGFRVARTLTS